MPTLTNSFLHKWDPGDLNGIVLWLRADDLAALGDGASVASWVGRKGNTFAQATGTKQPKVYTSTTAHLIGGQPAVTFDGTDDLLVLPLLFGSPQSGSIVAVLRVNAIAVAATASIFTASDEATTTKSFRANIARPTSDVVLQTRQENTDTADTVSSATTPLTIGTAYVVEWSSTGSAYGFRVNDVAQAKTVIGGSDNGDWIGDSTARDNAVLGGLKRTTESTFASIDLAELFRTDNATMSSDERALLNPYLNNRYGFSL